MADPIPRLPSDGPEGVEGEQREWIRLPGSPETTCAIILPGGPEFAARLVQNVSAAGTTLVIGQIVPVGTTVTAEFRRPSHDFSCRRAMRIVYIFKSQGDDYVLGGAFSPILEERELKELI